MDIEKLINTLKQHGVSCVRSYGRHCSICDEAATALSTLQVENEEMQKHLNEFSEFLCHMTGGLLSKTNYTAQEMISAAEDYQQKVCGECDLRAENEKLREELEQVKKKNKYSAHDVALILSDAFGDSCACNFNGNDEWLPEKCELLEACPDVVGVACWEQYLKWRGQKED